VFDPGSRFFLPSIPSRREEIASCPFFYHFDFRVLVKEIRGFKQTFAKAHQTLMAVLHRNRGK
jgi:hypothetical protein